MTAFQVEPGGLVAAATVAAECADGLREVAAGIGATRPATPLRGGLDAALARFAEDWRDGHRLLADRVDDLGDRLVQAAESYDAVDGALRRAAGG